MTDSKLILELNKRNIIKFGSFTLKSGAVSPIYIDLRVLVSYPDVIKEVARRYVRILKTISFKRMVAVPYAAIPIVAAISAINEKPWIYTRKEVKNYGTKKIIEGEYREGERAVVVDDLITTGLSKLEVMEPVKKAGLTIRDVVVFIDREQGGKEQLGNHGIRLHRVFTLTQILDVLEKHGRLSKEKLKEVKTYLSGK